MSQPQEAPQGEVTPVESLNDVLALWAIADRIIQDPSPFLLSPRSDPNLRTCDPNLFARDLADRLARYALSEDSVEVNPGTSIQTVFDSTFSSAAENRNDSIISTQESTGGGAAVTIKSSPGSPRPATSDALMALPKRVSNVTFGNCPVPNRGTLEKREKIAEGRVRASAMEMAALEEGIRTGSVKVSVGQLCQSAGLPEPQEGERYELHISRAPKERISLRDLMRRSTT
ncbi:hypothetical protein ACHAQH_005859 [Verticillium albo-atrum]